MALTASAAWTTSNLDLSPLATSTSCKVISLPQRVTTFTYQSGETDFELSPGPKVFTAATTIKQTISATIVATCFTPIPGVAVPPREQLSQTSLWIARRFLSPKSPRHWPTTPGLQTPSPRSLLTPPAPRPFRRSQPVRPSPVTPPTENPPACRDVSPLTWASLVITFISIQLTWWLFDVPLLWAKESGGFNAFIHAVSWTCLWIHSPGMTGIIAFGCGNDASEMARMYYLAPKPGEWEKPDEWKTWKIAKSVILDVFTIGAVIVTLYQACTLPATDSRRVLSGLSLWAYPTLPVALIGLCLLLGERFFPRTKTGNVRLLVFTIVVLVLVGTAVSLVLWRFDTTDLPSAWWISAIFYTLMCLPLIFCSSRLMFYWCLIAGVVRVGGVSYAALNHYSGGQPYCKIRGAAFGAVYITFGVVAAILGGHGAARHSALLNRKWTARITGEHVQTGYGRGRLTDAAWQT